MTSSIQQHSEPYRVVLFDLDGTLLDTSEGIYNGTDYMTDQMGLERVPDDVKPTFIGPPLSQRYHAYFGLEGDVLKEAVATYRRFYGETGYAQAEPYPGMKELLLALRERGVKTGVATMKREDMAFKSIEAAGLLDLFDVVVGNSDFDAKTKAGLIEDALLILGEDRDGCVLIGDTIIDADGARKADVDFIAARYGFGLKDDKEFETIPMVLAADDVPTIQEFLIPKA